LSLTLPLLFWPPTSAQGQVVGCRTVEVGDSGQPIRIHKWFPPGQFARLQVDSAFAGISTTDDQRDRATAIIQTTMVEIGRLSQPGPNANPLDSVSLQARRLMEKRNAALNGLLTNEQDQNRLRSNLELMRLSVGRCDDP
jgi:hypothetical protein